MDNYYLAALCAIVPGLGRRKLPPLLAVLGSAQAVYEADAGQLRRTGLYSEQQIAAFVAARKRGLPEELAAFCRTNGVQLISYLEDGYPQALKESSDPPPVLYVRGRLPEQRYAVAVVGSRSASPYGLKAAAYFAGALATENVPIISGGARGIDTAAHQACLQAGGVTVAVFGCGIDVAYPAANRRLFEEIVAAGGALVTEYPPGTAPLSYHFPARNRIIAGLARGVLVVEAAAKSGAIITANIAADEGRDVYCVPGNIFLHSSTGCHELIRNGAKLVDKPADILEERRPWHGAPRVQQQTVFTAAQAQGETKLPMNLSPLAQKLLDLLGGEPLALEDLTEASGAALAEISMELLELQAAGMIAADQARRYYRI